MKNNRGPVVFSLLLITVGTGWLLSVLNIIPQVNWAWTLGLAAIGASAFLLSGFDKFSVVVGLFFIAASGLPVLRQTGRIAPNIETPVLVIAAGLSRSPPRARWSPGQRGSSRRGNCPLPTTPPGLPKSHRERAA